MIGTRSTIWREVEAYLDRLQTMLRPEEGDSGRDALQNIRKLLQELREATEDELRLAGSYNRSLIEASLDPLITISPEGKITDVNTATELVTGRSRKELIGTEFALYFTDPERANAGYAEVFRCGMVRDYPLEIKHRDGHVTPVLYNASVYRDESGKAIGVFAAARDVSELKRVERELVNYQNDLEKLVAERTAELKEANEQLLLEVADRISAEKALRDNETLLRKVLDTLPIGVWITDEKGTIVCSNPAGRAIWGGARYVGIEKYDDYKGWWLDTGKRIEPEEWGIARVILQGETSLDEEIEIESFDGRRKIILNSAIPIRDTQEKITGAISINQDITKRKLREEERTRFITAIEQVTEAIIITDAAWTIQYINPGFEAMSGYTRKDCIGRSILVCAGRSPSKSFLKNVERTIQESGSWIGRYTVRNKNGTKSKVEGAVSQVRDRAGRIVNYVIIERDVSRELEAEERLRQSQKMEAIGTLAGGIAHDFNNILGVIFGYTQLALNMSPKESQISTYLEDVLSASYRAKELVAQILSFSRRNEQKRSPILMSIIIKEAVKFLKASLPSTIEIVHDIHISSEAGLDSVMADPTQVHQLLMNLCTNAAFAMREKGGTLTVGLKDVILSACEASQYPDLKPGPYLKLTVGDNGPGIDPAIIDRIFEPYFTTKKAGEGTGLGLAVVHGIVKGCDGAVTVESEVGKGTSFCILLPRIDSLMKEGPDISEPIAGGVERILFVDDEDAMVRMWGKLLAPLGYGVVCKNNSIDALDYFHSHSDELDLVITDQTMPNMTGINLARELLRIRPDIPIILCTGYSELVTPQDARAAGISEFLTKPLVLRSLAETIRRVMDRR